MKKNPKNYPFVVFSYRIVHLIEDSLVLGFRAILELLLHYRIVWSQITNYVCFQLITAARRHHSDPSNSLFSCCPDPRRNINVSKKLWQIPTVCRACPVMRSGVSATVYHRGLELTSTRTRLAGWGTWCPCWFQFLTSS